MFSISIFLTEFVWIRNSVYEVQLTCCVRAKSCPTLCNPLDCSLPSSIVHGVLGKNTGMGCHFFLQGIFLIQGLNPSLLHWQADSLPLSHSATDSTTWETSQ